MRTRGHLWRQSEHNIDWPLEMWTLEWLMVVGLPSRADVDLVAYGVAVHGAPVVPGVAHSTSLGGTT